MNDFASAENEERIEQVRENFQNAKQKAEQAKQDYEDKAYERVGFEGEEITYKDALLLSFLKEKIGDFSWNQENGRVFFIRAWEKFFPSSGKVYFPDNIEVLDFCRAMIQSPENIKLPSSLEGILFARAVIQKPENLKLPDNLEEIHLGYTISKNLENIKLPKNLQKLFLEGVTMEKLKEYRKKNPNIKIYQL